MIRNHRLLGLTLILSILTQIVAAQTVSRTSYFVENSTHRHLMNPALTPYRGYLSVPVLGELYVGTESNLKFTNFIYPAVEGSDGKMITFLHPSINGQDFLNSLGGDQYLNTDVRTSILSYGRWMGETGFLTFDVGTRMNVSMNLPKDLFAFAKMGMNSSAGNTYHLDNFTVSSSMIAEGALGYSMNLTEAIRVGAKGKVLVGGAYAKAGLKQLELKMTPNQWTVSGQGQLDVYGKGVSFVNDTSGNVSNFKMGSPGLGGLGMAFDLGMEWAPTENFKLSASVVDFGGIKWKKENIKSARSTGTATFSGLEKMNPDSVGKLDMQDQIENVKDNIIELSHFKEQSVANDFIQKLNPTINVGLELGLMSNRVSVGGLYSTRLLDNGRQYSEYMASLNLKPYKWFNLSGSYSFQHGQKETFGFALGFVPGIVNIFLACDYVPTRFSKQFIPLNTSTTNFQIGISIPLSKKKVIDLDEEEDDLEGDPLTDSIPPLYE